MIKRIDVSGKTNKKCECCGGEFKDGQEIIQYTYYDYDGDSNDGLYCSDECVLKHLKEDEFGYYSSVIVELYSSFDEAKQARIDEAKFKIIGLSNWKSVNIEDKFIVTCFLDSFGENSYLIENTGRTWSNVQRTVGGACYFIEQRMKTLFRNGELQ